MIHEIANFIGKNENTILFDVCCGTGAIGICLSDLVRKVLGFELVEAAV
jgi:tRNA/tmRNA/rRNA uracil-C5-methylase (TrmA/RlmC/RlmD family)